MMPFLLEWARESESRRAEDVERERERERETERDTFMMSRA